ncbi:hypothetical protein [Aestuariispira insulae]|uniref:hypothetical protein n=1 Tax=Aestuariispira insulae TaxID=1461337 RepID=UPI0011C0629A|nr:hypothetical protein [Aestuariispira insulae]
MVETDRAHITTDRLLSRRDSLTRSSEPGDLERKEPGGGHNEKDALKKIAGLTQQQDWAKSFRLGAGDLLAQFEKMSADFQKIRESDLLREIPAQMEASARDSSPAGPSADRNGLGRFKEITLEEKKLKSFCLVCGGIIDGFEKGTRRIRNGIAILTRIKESQEAKIRLLDPAENEHHKRQGILKQATLGIEILSQFEARISDSGLPGRLGDRIATDGVSLDEAGDATETTIAQGESGSAVDLSNFITKKDIAEIKGLRAKAVAIHFHKTAGKPLLMPWDSIANRDDYKLRRGKYRSKKSIDMPGRGLTHKLVKCGKPVAGMETGKQIKQYLAVPADSVLAKDGVFKHRASDERQLKDTAVAVHLQQVIASPDGSQTAVLFPREVKLTSHKDKMIVADCWKISDSSSAFGRDGAMDPDIAALTDRFLEEPEVRILRISEGDGIQLGGRIETILGHPSEILEEEGRQSIHIRGGTYPLMAVTCFGADTISEAPVVEKVPFVPIRKKDKHAQSGQTEAIGIKSPVHGRLMGQVVTNPSGSDFLKSADPEPAYYAIPDLSITDQKTESKGKLKAARKIALTLENIGLKRVDYKVTDCFVETASAAKVRQVSEKDKMFSQTLSYLYGRYGQSMMDFFVMDEEAVDQKAKSLYTQKTSGDIGAVFGAETRRSDCPSIGKMVATGGRTRSHRESAELQEKLHTSLLSCLLDGKNLDEVMKSLPKEVHLVSIDNRHRNHEKASRKAVTSLNPVMQAAEGGSRIAERNMNVTSMIGLALAG